MYTPNSGLICPIKKDPMTTTERNGGYGDRHTDSRIRRWYSLMSAIPLALSVPLSLSIPFHSGFFLPLSLSATWSRAVAILGVLENVN